MIGLLQDTYPLLTVDEIISAAENGMILALSKFFSAQAMVAWNINENRFEIVLVGQNSSNEIAFEDLSKPAKRQCKYMIERELARRQVLQEQIKMAKVRGLVCEGEITKIDKTGGLDVWLSVDMGGVRIEHRQAYCAKMHQPVKERITYQIGQVLQFYVSSIVPVEYTHSGAAFLAIMVSRMATDFPAALLRKLTGEPEITCCKRSPNHFCHVWLPRRVDKKYLVEASRELRERIHARIVGQAPHDDRPTEERRKVAPPRSNTPRPQAPHAYPSVLDRYRTGTSTYS